MLAHAPRQPTLPLEHTLAGTWHSQAGSDIVEPEGSHNQTVSWDLSTLRSPHPREVPVLGSPHSKELGAYYTPTAVVESLVQWATQTRNYVRVLDPSCGDGRFLEGLENAYGIDIDPTAAKAAASLPGGPTIVNADFFTWATRTDKRFGAAIGNPPFIRYQRFNGQTRTNALALCRANGVGLTALSSSWAPFVVGSASLLDPGGRIGFVVPAEIGHAVYARPVIRYLLASFERVEVIAIREKIFPELSEDCWLLRARGFGRSTNTLHFVRLDQFTPDESLWHFEPIPDSELAYWDYRLRPLLLAPETRQVYRDIAHRPKAKRLGSIARLGIGYVTGANDFFHLRPSVAARIRIPKRLLKAAVRSNRDLSVSDVDHALVNSWVDEDRRVLLLNLAGERRLPKSVLSYLDSQAGQEARRAFKCRNRNPWYVVPDVQVPDAFLSIMSGRSPRLIGNSAGVVCTNSVHAVHFANGVDSVACLRNWGHPLTVLSCEVEGHALGGGLLKIEPAEARNVILAQGIRLSQDQRAILLDGIRDLQRWRKVNVVPAA